jgi:predicted N-formylglutamate amidohydrolase
MQSYLFSCEHATCAVPEAYRELFREAEDAVQSGEGWEPGSLNLAQAFSMKFRTPLVHGDVTRLLIDLEKDGDGRWSRFSMKLPEATRAKIADRHERPFRATLLQRIAEDLRRHAAVLHVLVHTSEEIDGRIRLETPASAPRAQSVASAWRNHMRAAEIDVLHFHDAPRNATEEFLAAEFAGQPYEQLRLTVAQSFFLEGRPWRWETMKKFLVESLSLAADEALALNDPGFPSTAQA